MCAMCVHACKRARSLSGFFPLFVCVCVMAPVSVASRCLGCRYSLCIGGVVVISFPSFHYIEVYVRGDYMQRLCYLLSHVMYVCVCVCVLFEYCRLESFTIDRVVAAVESLCLPVEYVAVVLCFFLFFFSVLIAHAFFPCH